VKQGAPFLSQTLPRNGMSPASAPQRSVGGSGKCVFAVVVPLAIALATILSSTVMTGVSEDAASEAHRLDREAIWDIPVMDTLRMWKRSMGTVGSGKLRLEDSYENGEIQVGGRRGRCARSVCAQKLCFPGRSGSPLTSFCSCLPRAVLQHDGALLHESS